MWQADNGQSGVRFLNLGSESRRLLQQWLKARISEEKKAKQATAGK